MTYTKFIKMLSFFIALTGLIVAIGWIFDINTLKGFFPGLVSMKFTTAICFISSSFVLYFSTTKKIETSMSAQVILPPAILLILLLMVTLFISAIFNLNTGLDNIFIQESIDAINTYFPGRPSIPTMFNFILISICGILILSDLKKYLLWLGTTIVIISNVAVLGYIINQPLLYFLIVGENTAMALLTALLFMLIGIGFIICDKTVSK